MRQPMRWMLALVLILALLRPGIVIGPARGIELAPTPIDQPVPTELRAPFGQFLRELGVKDVEATINNTKTRRLVGFSSLSAWVFRLESICSGEICLTIIGQVSGKTVQSQLMFMAEKLVSQSDVLSPLFNQPAAAQFYFVRTNNRFDDKSPVILTETPKGWIVSPSFK